MNFSENIIQEIARVAKEQDTSLFDAALIFCEQGDIEIEDFIKNVDKNTMEILRMSAVDQHCIRKKHLPKSGVLDFS